MTVLLVWTLPTILSILMLSFLRFFCVKNKNYDDIDFVCEEYIKEHGCSPTINRLMFCFLVMMSFIPVCNLIMLVVGGIYLISDRDSFLVRDKKFIRYLLS